MILSKILISLFFAGITVALFYPAIQLGQEKNILDIPEDKCVKPGKSKGEYCQEWNGACYSGSCSNQNCTNCVKPLQVLPTLLLFLGTITFLITAWFLLDGLLGSPAKPTRKKSKRV